MSSLLLLCFLSGGTLELPWVFEDHMVLQREAPIPIWGTAKPRSTVHVSFDGEEQQVKADAQGAWKVTLAPRNANGEGKTLRIWDAQQFIELNNVVVGDVWLCAGQSNMDFPVRSSLHSSNDLVELAHVRLCNRGGSLTGASKAFSLEQEEALQPDTYYSGSWAPATSDQIAAFSGVGFFFAQSMRSDSTVPIGMVDISVGGSSTEGWVPTSTLEQDAELAPLAEDYLNTELSHSFIRNRSKSQLSQWLKEKPKGEDPNHFFSPGFLFEAGIRPLAPFSIRGVLWYQGESNAHLPGIADKLFRHLVADWRALWESPELPFFVVQLPGMNRPSWPEFRHVQRAWESIDGVFVATSIDVGHPTDVHPKNKKPVGERLALLAKNKLFGQEIVCHGPTLLSSSRSGKSLILKFQHADGMDWNGESEKGPFEIAGKDKRFFPAEFEIQSKSISLSSAAVSAPLYARYGEAPFPTVGLVNEAGLPAPPFRTYDWQPIRIACVGDSITEGAGVGNPASESYPAQLQSFLGDGYFVKNFGRSGCCVTESTMKGSWHRAYTFNPEHEQAQLFQPDVVVCNLGINDIMAWDAKKKEFQDDYVDLIRGFQKLNSQPKVMIWSPLAPLFPGQKFHKDKNEIEIHKAIQKVARKAKVKTVDLHEPLLEHSAWFPDHIHPNAQGAKAIAKIVYKALQKEKFIRPTPLLTKVFVLTGQSNSLGTTADTSTADNSPGEHPADAHVRFFWNNRSTRAGDGLATSIGNSDGVIQDLVVQQGEGKNKTFWGPEFGFARALYDSGERNFLVVKASRGGGGNSFWFKKARDHHMYDHVVETVEQAVQQLGPHEEFELTAVFYVQGESDNNQEAGMSGERVQTLFKNLKKDLPNAKNMRFIIGGIGAAGARRDLVRANHEDAAKKTKGMDYFSNTDLASALYDKLHFNKVAKLLIGERFFKAYLAGL